MRTLINKIRFTAIYVCLVANVWNERKRKSVDVTTERRLLVFRRQTSDAKQSFNSSHIPSGALSILTRKHLFFKIELTSIVIIVLSVRPICVSVCVSIYLAIADLP